MLSIYCTKICKHASKEMFNDECGPNFKCHDYQDETKSNVEKAGATFKTKAYVCSKKIIDNDKLCMFYKRRNRSSENLMEKWIIAVVVVAILILITLCVGLCYCRRRMKRSGAAASTAVSNPYLK